MPTGSWWAAAINPKGLSQGDLVSDVPIGTPHIPLTYLGRNTWPAKGKTYWPQTAKLDPFKSDATGLYVARGRITMALIVSHSCELDDKPDVGRVLVAPVAPLTQISDSTARARILERKRRAFMPLPEIPGLGDHYADLRCIAQVDRKFTPDSKRQLSMSDDGVVMLRAQLIAFFTRLDPESMMEGLATSLAVENR